MNICKTQWSPDTCGCVIEYTWDSDVPVEQRVHTPHATIKHCSYHEQHKDKKVHHDVLVEENQRKNMALDHIKTATDLDHEWFFDNDRVLHLIDKQGKLDKQKKGKAQEELSLRFGMGKVKLE